MSEQTPNPANPIHVTSITMQRYGRTLVTRRAPVKDTQHFSFTVPKANMQEILDSLEVYDSRGSIPRISFPAPFSTNVKPLVLSKKSAWKDLLMRHQGAHVELHTRSGLVDGYFLGFQLEEYRGSRFYPPDNGPALVLQTGANICMHPIASISAIAFKSPQLANKLDRSTSTLSRLNETDSVYRINITATGVGTGEICATYALSSPFGPAFDFSYTIYDDELTDAQPNNKPSHALPNVPSKVTVKCYAIIRNSLHHDINDSQIILHSGHYRADQVADMYRTTDGQRHDQSRSTSSSSTRSPSRTRNRSRQRNLSPSPKRESPVRSPSPRPPKAPSYSDQSGSDSSSESDSGSSVCYSTTSLEASRYDRTSEWFIPGKISIKEGESVKVLLAETRMEGGVVNVYAANHKMRHAFMLHNTTDDMFEPGPAMFFTQGLCVKTVLPCLKPGEDVTVEHQSSACAVERTKSSRRGNVLSSRIMGKELVAKVTWFHQTRYLMHNKEDKRADIFIAHESRKKTGNEVDISARLYQNASPAGDEEDDGTGVELDHYSEGTLYWRSYLIRMAPKQRCSILVNETELNVEKHSIFGCSPEAIAKLEQMKVAGPLLIERLRELAEMSRKMERLNRTKKLHRTRLDGIKGYERGLAQANISNDTGDEDDGNKRFFGAVLAAEDSIAEIEDSLDAIECEKVKLMGQMKARKEEICDMKRVDLENEVKKVK